MAEDEQFSLCWNNFNSNLSAGFHESLCKGDLVDVTLAAEGQLVKAHRLVLSVCSPYFRKMFTQMPANQHAFVFLKDVSHAALKDLIQFMYCGEVNVKQDALPAFISTAEALQIKGLTEGGDQQSNLQTCTQTPISIINSSTSKEASHQSCAPSRIATIASQHVISAGTSRTSLSRTLIKTSRPQYKMEGIDEGGDDKVIQLQTTPTAPTSKRPAHKSLNPIVASTAKKLKTNPSSSNDPLEVVESTHIAMEDKDDEFISLPLELNPKNEPSEFENVPSTVSEAEIQEQDQEASFVEEDAYGEITKYEEQYFTEGDVSTKAGQSSLGESYSATEQDQSNNETQDHTLMTPNDASLYPFEFIVGRRGSRILLYRGIRFTKNRINSNGTKIYWICSKKHTSNCNARVVTYEANDQARIIHVSGKHVHSNENVDQGAKGKAKRFSKALVQS